MSKHLKKSKAVALLRRELKTKIANAQKEYDKARQYCNDLGDRRDSDSLDYAEPDMNLKQKALKTLKEVDQIAAAHEARYLEKHRQKLEKEKICDRALI